MPIYEYECNGCGDQHEFIQKFSESPKRKCPSCGKLRLRELISAAAFHLKGGGWYVTDFRDGGKKAATDSGESPGSSAATDTSADKPAKDSAGQSQSASPDKTSSKSDSKSSAKKDKAASKSASTSSN